MALPYGLKVLAEGTDPVTDIVAVHGLNGHREETWTANDVNWLRDFLPSDIPNARILTWGYDANTHSTSQSQISAQSLYDHAKTLVSDLCLKRSLTKTRKRPILFVAHSLGGIVVKSAMIHSDAARQGALEEHRSIKLSTYGIFFLGTPHQGGNGVHLGELMLKVASIFVRVDDKILKHLERDSEWLQQQLGQYGPINRDFVTKFAYETYPTRIALGKTLLVVPQASAIIPGAADAEAVAILADHLNMVKFTSREDGGYEKVSGHLQLLAEKAPDAINVRWAKQDRIREALSKSEDFSVPFSLSGVPDTEQFVGRDKELIEIREAFHGDGSHRKTVILQGLGGIGKTQLAVTFAKQQRDTFSAVFWLNSKNEDALKQSFADMAKRLYNLYQSSTLQSSKLLRTAVESKDPDQIVDAMKLWLSAKNNIQWMLIFDNMDNPKLRGIKDPQAYDIRLYFPEAHQGFILITTRSFRLKIGKVIRLKKLQEISDCIAILAHMSEREISDKDPHAVELAKRLDGLPLALATAGAYLCQVSTSLADYLVHYNSSWLKLQEKSPELESYEDRALYSTWNISYENICSRNESAGKLLQLWAYFDNQDLWYALLAGGRDYSPEWFSNIIGDELRFEEAIRLLCDHALVESRGVSSGYGMHGCVHAWTIYGLSSEKDISMAELAFSCVGSTVPDKTVPDYWALQQRLLPHAQRCLDLIHNSSLFDPKLSDHILDAAHNIGDLYSDHDKIKESEEMYLRALKGKEVAWGVEHTSTLLTVNKLGTLYKIQDKIEEAEEMYLRALKGNEMTWGAEHTSILKTVTNLGSLYLAQGKIKQAEEMYLRALMGYEKACGAEHISTLDVVNNLGVLYKTQGQTKKAEEMYLRALAGYEKAWGAEHTLTLDTVKNLGNLYIVQGKMRKTEEMYLRALAGYEKAWGDEHSLTLGIFNNLGNLYSAQGKMKEAEDMYLRALTGYEKACGTEHSLTLETVHNLGIFYTDQAKMKDAEKMLLRALAGKEKVWGVEHTLTLETVDKLASLYSAQGKMEESEEMYLRALAGLERALGAENTLTLNVVHNLGILYLVQGKLKEAEAMLLRVLTGMENAWGAEHKSTLVAVHSLGNLYSAQGKMKEAEAMYLRSLAGWGNVLGAEHTSTLTTASCLARLYSIQGKMMEAEEMNLRSLKGFENTWGPDHPSTLDIVNNLGILYSDQGKLKEAEDMYLRALTANEKGQGAEHPSTLRTVNNLACLYLKTEGKMQEAEELYLRALTGQEKAWGAEHTATLLTANNLGNLYRSQGKMKEAEEMYLRALTGNERALGAKHKQSLDTRYNMAILYGETQQFDDAIEQLELVAQGYTEALGPDHRETTKALDLLNRFKAVEGGTKIPSGPPIETRIPTGSDT